jgi:hypothetical protein
MLTLRRFKAMAASYGADLWRWPEAVRADARVLLADSPEARAFLQEAQRLDDALEAASAREDTTHWRPGEQAAALARLRSGVESRIAAAAACRPAQRRTGWTLSATGRWGHALRLRWVGMATGGGFAIMAGLLIGALYASAPEPDPVLMMLQPAPIHALVE